MLTFDSMSSTPSVPSAPVVPAVKSKEQFKSEIAAAVHNVTTNVLLDGLADANVRIVALEKELQELKQPKKPDA